MTDPATEDELRLLLDEAAIRRVHLRYCRGVDRSDWEMVRACYHPDGTDDHGAYSGGVDGFIAWVQTAAARYESTSHFTGNQLVEVNGDRAWAEHYAVAFHRVAATPEAPAADIVGVVRYLDSLERRNGEWRILNRTLVGEIDRIDPVGRTWFAEALKRGARGAADPSHESRAHAIL